MVEDSGDYMKKLYFIVFALTLLLTGCATEGEKLANKMDLDGESFCHVKKGYYCGEGICKEDHGIGYIYYTDALTQDEAMAQAGFEKIDDTEYTNHTETAVIADVRTFGDGYLLEYHITGSG